MDSNSPVTVPTVSTLLKVDTFKFLEKDYSIEKGTITFILGDKTTFEYNISQLSKDTIIRLAYHGLLQKIGDSCAGFSKSKDYKSAKEAIASTWLNLTKSVWTTRTGGGGVSTEKTKLNTAVSLVQALFSMNRPEIEISKVLSDSGFTQEQSHNIMVDAKLANQTAKGQITKK